MNLKIFARTIEDEATAQIHLLLSQEAFEDCKVRIMPDVHAGKGCVIGFTADLGDKVIPNIVGVDIGCGMYCVELGKVDIDFEKLDNIIRKCVPSGMNVHNEVQEHFDFEKLLCYSLLKNKNGWLEKSLGTLGGGNHFIEVDIDEEDNKYLIIHTGSRNLGKQVAEIYQNEAIHQCSYEFEMQAEKNLIIDALKLQGREKEIQSKLNEITEFYKGKTKLPKELCYLEGELREAYLHDMKLCQEFATLNRDTIARNIIFGYFGQFEAPKISVFETIHNYISFEDNIVRKGAISARKDEKLLIPLNMREGCIIGVGKGNEDWNNSAPHGAGRTMSRAKAREVINFEAYKQSMNGIYTTSVNRDTIDESPFVYKPKEEIIEAIQDTVEIQKIIKPLYNFKASE